MTIACLKSSDSNVVSMMVRCEVCGHAKAKSLLQKWNDRQVCKGCIEDITAEIQEDVFHG